ncbi:mu-like prophage FluMu gp41 family protein [Serratia ureilytica]|uniref:phage tail assembly protein n=1 Tax=Serratia ureilytica TaxID=300181 RepID=UPI0006279B0C|nr:phage tail assembly protein [Serratia ureilytica]KKO59210.1 mu-like prophage FluMu gp41 family protein [Serratia ureilytica]
MKELVLSKPIMAHNEKLHVLEIQEPDFDQIEACGIPFSYTDKGEMRLDTRSALAYIPILAGIPRSSAQQMAPKDILMATMTIISFFTDSGTLPNSEGDSTIPPTSGN